jgi:hypothetical protein
MARVEIVIRDFTLFRELAPNVKRKPDLVAKQADVFAMQINSNVVVLRGNVVFAWGAFRKRHQRPPTVTQ